MNEHELKHEYDKSWNSSIDKLIYFSRLYVESLFFIRKLELVYMLHIILYNNKNSTELVLSL